MSGEICDRIRDLLPAWASEALPGEERSMVESHLASCRACRGEAEVVSRLLEARPRAPQGLEERIQSRLREEMVQDTGQDSPFGPRERGEEGAPPAGLSGPRRFGSWIPSWALPAAAVVVLALGIGVLMDGMDGTPDGLGPEPRLEPVRVAAESPAPEEWLWDDGLVAGAPVLEDLTEDELMALIEELEG